MALVKLETTSLTGERLDYAVAVTVSGCKEDYKFFLNEYLQGKWNYSTCWNKGGPLIERFMIKVFVIDDSAPTLWCAEFSDPFRVKASVFSCIGDNPLQAAMRCIITSRAGLVMLIPSELNP